MQPPTACLCAHLVRVGRHAAGGLASCRSPAVCHVFAAVLPFACSLSPLLSSPLSLSLSACPPARWTCALPPSGQRMLLCAAMFICMSAAERQRLACPACPALPASQPSALLPPCPFFVFLHAEHASMHAGGIRHAQSKATHCSSRQDGCGLGVPHMNMTSPQRRNTTFRLTCLHNRASVSHSCTHFRGARESDVALDFPPSCYPSHFVIL